MRERGRKQRERGKGREERGDEKVGEREKHGAHSGFHQPWTPRPEFSCPHISIKRT